MGEAALEPGHDQSRRPHPFRKIGMRELGGCAGLYKRTGELELRTEPIMGFA